MTTAQIRHALQKRPRLALQWAKRFHFCQSKHHHEYPEYAERAFLVYQTILWAANKDLKLIVDWVIEKWQREHSYPFLSSFGENPSIEFDYVKDFVDHMMMRIVDERPRLLKNWMFVAINYGGNCNWLSQKWLESVYDKKPSEALGIIRELFAVYPEELSRDWGRPVIQYNVRSVLRTLYQKDPERILTFFEKYASRLSGMGDMMDEILK